MLIHAGYDIAFGCDHPVPMVANLSVHVSRLADLRTAQRIATVPDVPKRDFIDGFGNTCTRLVMPTGGLSLSCQFVIEDPFLLEAVSPDSVPCAPSNLPDDVLIYLRGSRYCETDRLNGYAWALFGSYGHSPALVSRIFDYVHDTVQFNYLATHPQKTAWDVFHDHVGVCRDFAHLAIALCRCMNLPARYCTGYLGDMDWPEPNGPMDFSAWVEVWLAGRWYVFDARHNVPRRGRILMSRGRDAADTAIMTNFGEARLLTFNVHTDENSMALAKSRKRQAPLPKPDIPDLTKGMA